MLGINALAFFLSFSLDAFIAFVLGIAAFFIVLPREKRAGMFTICIFTIVQVLACTAIAPPGLGKSGIISVMPIIAAAAAGFILFGLLKLPISLKPVYAVYFGLAAVIYITAAFFVTAPYEVERGKVLKRGAYPDAGTYEFKIDADPGINVEIMSQNLGETEAHTSTELLLEDGVFTVPEDSVVVYFSFDGEGEIRSASYGGKKISFKYPMLPSFAANRLQGLFANQNAIQRIVMFKDGLKLFMRAPVFGGGLTAFEARIGSVQTVDYTSQFVHNHYIECWV